MEQVETQRRPLRLEVYYPETSSRLLAVCSILYPLKLVMLLPTIIVWSVFSIVYLLGSSAGLLAVLFTARYPRGIFDFNVRFHRWSIEIALYLASAVDTYPPLLPSQTDAGQHEPEVGRPVRLDIDLPERSSRVLAICTLLFYPRWLITLPVGIAACFVIYAMIPVAAVGMFGVLFTGRYPRRVFGLFVDYLGWVVQIWLYNFSMTDRYPPFSPW